MTPQLEKIVISREHGDSGNYVMFDFQWWEDSELAIKPQRARFMIRMEGCNVAEAFSQASDQAWDEFQNFLDDDKQEVLPNVLG